MSNITVKMSSKCILIVRILLTHAFYLDWKGNQQNSENDKDE